MTEFPRINPSKPYRKIDLGQYMIEQALPPVLEFLEEVASTQSSPERPITPDEVRRAAERVVGELRPAVPHDSEPFIASSGE